MIAILATTARTVCVGCLRQMPYSTSSTSAQSSAKASRPGEELLAAGGLCGDTGLGEAAAASCVERHDGVALHVRVDADYDHVSPSLVGCNRSRAGTVGGRILVRASCQAPVRSRRRPSAFRRRSTQEAEVSPMRATDQLGVTPPSEPRLPEAAQESHEKKCDTKIRLLGGPVTTTGRAIVRCAKRGPLGPGPRRGDRRSETAGG